MSLLASFVRQAVEAALRFLVRGGGSRGRRLARVALLLALTLGSAGYLLSWYEGSQAEETAAGAWRARVDQHIERSDGPNGDLTQLRQVQQQVRLLEQLGHAQLEGQARLLSMLERVWAEQQEIRARLDRAMKEGR